MSDEIGGNWYYKNPNGMSACYESLHIDTSKWRLAFEDYPVPADWPDFPHHAQLLQYFNDYVDHFGLRETITFNTAVTTGRTHRRRPVGGDAVDRRDPALRRAVRLQRPPLGRPHAGRIPASSTVRTSTPTHYRDPFDPVDMRGKNVVVVGMGNSAMDIATELAQRPIAKKPVRLGPPRRLGAAQVHGRQAGRQDVAAALDAAQARPGAGARQDPKKTVGNMEDYGLPKPDHEPLEAHPSVSAASS